jgi:hypothetical protein
VAIIWDQPSSPIAPDEDKEADALIEEAEADEDAAAIIEEIEKARPFLDVKGFGR